MTKYKFIGEGAGVPGLPHEITQAEVEQLTTDELNDLNDAVAMGLYIKVDIEAAHDLPEGE